MVHSVGVMVTARYLMELWNGRSMEYWELKSDGGLILILILAIHIKLDPIPTNPVFHYSITPGYSITAEPLNSDLALRTRFSLLE